jgi:hypothetical protein
MTIPEGFELVDMPEGFEEVPEEKEGFWKKAGKEALGLGETGLNLLTSIPAGVYGPAVGISARLQGASPDEADQIAGRSMAANTYAPRGEEGQRNVEAIGHVMNQVGIPLAGVAHTLGANKLSTANRVAKQQLNAAARADALGKASIPEPMATVKTALPEGYELVGDNPNGSTPMQKQLALSEAMEAREQAFADRNNIQGELDLRPKQMPVDENGMPVDMARSLELQEATRPEQADLFNEDFRTQAEMQRAADLEQVRKQEAELQPPVDRPSPEQVARETEASYAQRELDLQEQAKAEKQQLQADALQGLEDTLRKGQYTPPDRSAVRQARGRIPKSQRGAVNPEVFVEGFEKVKDLANGIRLRITGEGPYARVKATRLEDTFDGGKYEKPIGLVDINREGEFAQPKWVKVNQAEQGKGLAREMYQFFAEQGNDIIPDAVQTSDGKALWDSLANKSVAAVTDNGYVIPGSKTNAIPPLSKRFDIGEMGLVPRNEMYIPRSQRGGIDFKSVSEAISEMFKPGVSSDAPKIVKNIIGESAIPKDPTPSDIVNRALQEGGDTSAWNATKYTASGGSLEALTRKSALVQGVSEIVQNAKKRSDLLKQKTIVPLEKLFRSLSTNEVVNMAELVKDEMFNGKQFTTEMLEQAGFNEKQLKAYADFRKLREDALQIQNEQRQAVGLAPVSPVEFGMASRWRGDFRQPVYNADGSLAWYLADNTMMGLRKQAKALKKDFPELVIDEKKGHKIKNSTGKNDVQSLYSTMLDTLGRDNPEVLKIKEAMEAAVAAETASVAGQQKHFKHKGNIRGFVGDRPGHSPKTESLEMFQEQIQYAKNAYEWASMQEAGRSLKEVFSNEQLNEQQPKNMAYAQEYFQNNMGHGTAKWVGAIEDAFRELGVAPSEIGKHVGTAKSLFITQKLAASLGYTLANGLQVANVIPHLLNGFIKEGGNPLKGIAVGALTGPMMASTHYLSALDTPIKRLPGMEFYERAFKYAEDNGVTSRSVYDESPINNRGVVPTVARHLGKTMTVPETYIRSTAYMMFVNMLKDSKKFKGNETALFQKAEQLTNASMVDYRSGERPMMFSKLGIAGDALNTLQTFPMNLYNQYRYFGTEALRGNPMPLVALLATQMFMAGAQGIPGFNDMDKLWGVIKESLPDSAWAKVKDFDPKVWAIDNLGEAAVYGAVSTLSGVNMTSRLSAPGISDMAVSPAAPVMDLAKQAGSVAQAAVDPTNMEKVAQATRNVFPTGTQGFLETVPFKGQNAIPREDGTTLYKKATDLEDRQGRYARTPQEEKLRTLGLRSQREAFVTDLEYKASQTQKQTTERSKGMIEKYYSALRRGDDKKLAELQKIYTELNGVPISDQALETQLLEEYTTTLERSGITAGKKLEATKGLSRLHRMIKERDGQ